MVTRSLLRRPLSAIASSAWTCPSCTTRAASILPSHSSRTPSILQRSQPQRRSLHHRPPLPYDDVFTREGVPGLFTSGGYDIVWRQYQSMLASKLNELVAGEPIENDDARTLVLKFARDPENASVFNHASMMHNNHFFFRNLSSAPLPLAKAPLIQGTLEKEFGSIDTLKVTFLDTAAAMFGPGFVWLVWAREPTRSREGAWRILTTYNAGTPYPEAGFRQQGVDMNNQNKESFANYLDGGQLLRPTNSAGAFGAHSSTGRELAKMPPGGTTVMPVLCVSTWEHAYMYDFGVRGKREYLENWWNVIDWGSVEALAPKSALGANLGFHGSRAQTRWSER
ncbi:unnamed protein product [Zymoseptoria tritici ST99CH_3D7]|nr:unnamed protein product [Zymoseptoria tritici ST99CH_3D7]